MLGFDRIHLNREGPKLGLLALTLSAFIGAAAFAEGFKVPDQKSEIVYPTVDPLRLTPPTYSPLKDVNGWVLSETICVGKGLVGEVYTYTNTGRKSPPTRIYYQNGACGATPVSTATRGPYYRNN